MGQESRLATFCERILSCDTVEAAWQALGAEMERFGFDRMMFGMNNVGTEGRLEPIGDALVLVRGEQAYTDAYLESGFYRDAPFIAWAAGHRGALGWDDARVGLTPEQLAETRPGMVALMQRYGLKAGYNLSLAEPETSDVAVLSLAARAGLDQAAVDRAWAETGATVEMMCRLFYLRVKALPRPVPMRPLTGRQKEALRWFAAGKSTRDIAQIMGISMATVEKHLSGARAAFDVGSTAQAVNKATRFNLI